ncbi:hypothetical protein GPECTOR_55g270 [Gonium pectorale]|uniref:Right handed beta helix domain-containing protein n=1 Tax=Gonium pectorale TaxID=33097 RepID=A0A150G6B8_GONPE|nr:hypothetical protein GPECTOR_55g270 [Gonium pectorale]|eukprot:KXZ45364.1 hypothetical protein GPECTOR_55g270 [Gonium pectorale]
MQRKWMLPSSSVLLVLLLVCQADTAPRPALHAGNATAAATGDAGEPPAEEEDHGLTFHGAGAHLELADSRVEGVPHSAANPLIRFHDCAHVTLRDVSISSVQAPAKAASAFDDSGAGGLYHYYGAVLAQDLSTGATVTGLNCSGVAAAGLLWSCLMLQLASLGAGAVSAAAPTVVRIENSRFVENRGAQQALPLLVAANASNASLAAALSGLGLLASVADDPDAASAQLQAAANGTSSGSAGAGAAASGYFVPYGPVLVVLPAATAAAGGAPQGGSGCVSVDVRSSVFGNNTGGRGGGLAVELSQATLGLSLTGSIMSGNRALAGDGGAVYVRVAEGKVASAWVAGSTLSANAASGCGGALSLRVGQGDLGEVAIADGSALDHNAAGGAGGGAVCVSLQAGDLAPGLFVYGGSSLSDNRAAAGDGGAVLLAVGGRTVSAVNVSGGAVLSGNVAAGSGGALHMGSGLLGYLGFHGNSSFRDNRAGGAGGGGGGDGAGNGGDGGGSSSSSSSRGGGGAVYVETVSALVVEQSAFQGNEAAVSVTPVAAAAGGGGGSAAGDGSGGALRLGSATSITLRAASFVQNVAAQLGGGVFVSSVGRVLVEEGTTAWLNAAVSGGFLAATGASSVRLLDSEFVGNHARGYYYVYTYGAAGAANVSVIEAAGEGHGGALYLVSQNLASLQLQNSTFTTNLADGRGGAVFVRDSVRIGAVVASGITARGNRAGLAGGALAVGVAGPLGQFRAIGNSTFAANIVGTERAFSEAVGGGAVHIAADGSVGSFIVANGTAFVGNVAAGYGSGGAVLLTSAAGNITGSVADAHFADNTADKHGGALHVAVNGRLLMDGVTLVRLSVRAGSSFVRNTASGGRGGAVFLQSGHTDPRRLSWQPYAALAGSLSIAEGSRFEWNAAAAGGALFLSGFFALSASGGWCVGNVAVWGDGGCLGLNRFPPSLLLAGFAMSDNAAPQGSGGALSITTDPDDFADGTSASTGCLSCLMHDAGGSPATNMTLDSSSLTNNTAGRDGGAISLLLHSRCCNGEPGRGLLAVSGCNLTRNRATGVGSAGGAIALQQSLGLGQGVTRMEMQLLVRGSVLLRNTAGAPATHALRNTPSLGGAISVNNVLPPPNTAASAGVVAGGEAEALHRECAVLIRDSRFEENGCTGGHGGAVSLSSCLARIESSSFTSNAAGLCGGALAAVHSGRNRAMRDGGLPGAHFLWTAPTADQPDNSHDVIDDVISAGSSHVWFTDLANCSFTGNSADTELGGGAYLDAQANGRVALTNCSFLNNSARRQHGGAAFLAADGQGATIRVVGAMVLVNTAPGAGAGGFYVLMGPGANGSVAASSFAGNRAAYGGALVADVNADATLELAGCSISSNAASGDGGAVSVQARCGARVAIGSETTFEGNAAGGAGGAIAVQQFTGPAAAGASVAPSTSTGTGTGCRDGSAGLVWSGGASSNNSAGTDGGSLYVAPGSGANVDAVRFAADRSGGGGGSVAAQGCVFLTLAGCSIANGSAGTFGGGLFASGCEYVLAERVNVLDCSAGVSGGGLHLGSPAAQSGSGAAAAGLNSSTAGPEAVGGTGGRAILNGVLLSNNSAEGAAAVDLTCSSGVETVDHACSGGAQQSCAESAFYSRGGGLYVEGWLAVALSLSAFGPGNRARLGNAIASTQECPNAPGASGLAAVAYQGPPNGSLQRWARTWALLGEAVAQRCWALVLSQTLLPPASVTSSPASSPSPAPAAAGHHRRSALEANRLQIWLLDVTATALQASCPADTYARVRLTMWPEAPPTTTPAISQPDAEAAIEEAFKVFVTGGAEGAGGSALTGPTAYAASEARYRALQAGLYDCAADPTLVPPPVPSLPSTPGSGGPAQPGSGGDGSSSGAVLKFYPGLQLPPVRMRLVGPGGELWGGESLSLLPGSPWSAAVQLVNAFDQAVVADMGVVVVAMKLLPLGPSPGSGGVGNLTSPASSLNGSRPWLNSSLANLDPGPVSGRSLLQPVVRGRASWVDVVPRGWPGQYLLSFSVSPVTARVAIDGKVAPLLVRVSLQPCRLGERLDLDTAQEQAAPSWTGCAACRQGQFNLWEDARPRLTDASLDVANYSDVMWEATAQLLAHGDAACAPCPDHALCPGGAVLVPRPGYWHSAPNSTAFHPCLRPAACGGDGNTGYWSRRQELLAARMRSADAVSGSGGGDVDAELGSVLRDPRSQLLGRCQRDWYTGDVPGRDATAAFEALRLAVAVAAASADNGSAAWGVAESAKAAAEAGCLLWGLPHASPSSYMQSQCAPGYTGHLCAACQPGYHTCSDMKCAPCAGVAQTAVLGLVAFFGSALLVLYTALANLHDMADAGPPSDDGQPASKSVEPGEVVKAIVTHIQYFIIIVRLNLEYPHSIQKYQAVLNTITGAENYVLYSPSCLLPQRDSAGQAEIQLLAGLLTPCAVTLFCLLVCWARPPASSAPPSAMALVQQTTITGTHLVAPSSLVAQIHVNDVYDAGDDEGGDVTGDRLPTLAIVTSIQQQADGSVRSRNGGYGGYGGMSAAPSSRALSVEGHPGCAAGFPVAVEATSAAAAAGAEVAIRADSQVSPHGKEAGGWRIGSSLARQHSGSTAGPASCGVDRLVLGWLSGLVSRPSSLLTRVDAHLDARQQMGLVLMVASFVLYPGLSQAALSVFTCYRIDDGDGAFAAGQQATWRHGYWVRDMQQECYSGKHRSAYVPIGIVSVLAFCLLPPLASFVVVWRNRNSLKDFRTRQAYGFLYARYREKYFWWESVLQLETLALVAVEVFGRSLTTTQQALMLLAVFIVIALVNMSCRPMRMSLMLLEFMSLGTLSLTLTLGLYFALDDEPLSRSSQVRRLRYTFEVDDDEDK